MCKTLSIVLLLMVGFSGWADQQRFVLTQQQWNVPRSVQRILQMPALKQAMALYDANPGARLRLHYPGGDEGTLWATEVRSWLISLGLATSRIELLPGTRHTDALEIEVVTPTIDTKDGADPTASRKMK
jgi:hypothetical protein